MIHAYNEIYLDDAMQTIAELFSYCGNEAEADILFENFISNGAAYQFGRGNPYYINMPPQVLFEKSMNGKKPFIKPFTYERSKEYWCGFVLAYYQWYTGLSFKKIGKMLPPSKIISMYNPLHEASLEKFVDVANSIVIQKETNLAIYRKTAGFSQQELAKYSDVSLRAIQLYEERQLNINMAPSVKLFKLSKVLGCFIEDLLETTR